MKLKTTPIYNSLITSLALAATAMPPLHGGEEFLGRTSTAETLPQGAWEMYTNFQTRFDKGYGSYTAYDYGLELEYGVTARLQLSTELKFQHIESSRLLVDGYLPGDKSGGGFSGIDMAVKYNFLKPALDPIGLSVSFALDYNWLDSHSGFQKQTISGELGLQLQKYYLDGRLVLLGNFGLESTYADRRSIGNLPAGFEWSTDPEMELGLRGSFGLNYRFAPSWYIGAEAIYETEFETEVGQERWTIFAGPSLHYAKAKWWVTLTWLPQLIGGGELFPQQNNRDMHLIEKTKHEILLRVGFNF